MPSAVGATNCEKSDVSLCANSVGQPAEVACYRICPQATARVRGRFLSIKTVEAHLHRTSRKLGVRSRAELAPLVGYRDLGA